MAKLRQVLSGNVAKLEVNLKEIFGDELPNDTEFRQAFGQAIIDRIRDRTADNIDRNGKRFRNYSQEYADSIEFKAYNKSKGDPNLKQTGDMLNLMDIIEERENKIVIGWQTDEEAGKAHGHVTGNVGVKRDFLGLPDGEVEALAREFRGQVFSTSELPSVVRTEAFLAGEVTISPRQTLGSIVRSIFDDEA